MPTHHNVDRYFIDNEAVLKEWASKEWDGIYGTQHRVFFVKEGILNKKFIEASYGHISSIEFSRIRPKVRLICSIICFVSALFIYIFFGHYLYAFRYFRGLNNYILGGISFLVFFGIVFLIWFIIGIKKFMIHVNGRKPIVVSKELSDLIKYVRMKSIIL